MDWWTSSPEEGHSSDVCVEDIFRCYEVAEALEGMAVYLVTTRYSQGEINKENLKELDRLVSQMEMNIEKKSGIGWASNDDLFHVAIYRMCGNTSIIEFLDKTKGSIKLCALVYVPICGQKRVE